MGRYDFVIMAEAPNAEMVATVLLATGALGNVRTETLRAFTAAEFAKLVNSLPSGNGILLDERPMYSYHP